MNKYYLVIGGAGYIGSHQVKVMCESGYNVVVLDNLNTGFERAVDKNATFIKGDIRDKNILNKIFNTYNIEAVIHFAALSLVGESVKHPLEYYNNNVYGMNVLLEAMIDHDIKKIVFSSTAATYGHQKVMPITEEMSTNPINTYGETKLAMEKMMKWVSNAYDINFVSLRYFNVAGASLDSSIGENHNPETHLVPLVIKAALNDKTIKIFGDDYNTPDGTCIRDYIHVLDLVNAHILALDYLDTQKKDQIINLGYSKGFSVKQIINATQKVAGKEIKQEIVTRRPGDPDELIADNKKAIEVLKWKPKYNDIDVIISSAYNYHKTNI